MIEITPSPANAGKASYENGRNSKNQAYAGIGEAATKFVRRCRMKCNIPISEETKCLRCGGTNLKPAHFESTGKIYSRPKNAKLITLLTTGVLVNAILCVDCGHVELVVDTDKVKAISKEKQPAHQF
jgi:hypothetical protein